MRARRRRRLAVTAVLVAAAVGLDASEAWHRAGESVLFPVVRLILLALIAALILRDLHQRRL